MAEALKKQPTCALCFPRVGIICPDANLCIKHGRELVDILRTCTFTTNSTVPIKDGIESIGLVDMIELGELMCGVHDTEVQISSCLGYFTQ